jgi:hypothetical protein
LVAQRLRFSSGSNGFEVGQFERVFGFHGLDCSGKQTSCKHSARQRPIATRVVKSYPHKK